MKTTEQIKNNDFDPSITKWFSGEEVMQSVKNIFEKQKVEYKKLMQTICKELCAEGIDGGLYTKTVLKNFIKFNNKIFGDSK